MAPILAEPRLLLVTIPYRAFLHNLSVDDQLRALERVREHLPEEGRLPAERRREFLHPRAGNRVTIKEEFHYDLDRQSVEGAFIFDEIDGTSGNALTLRGIFR